MKIRFQKHPVVMVNSYYPATDNLLLLMDRLIDLAALNDNPSIKAEELVSVRYNEAHENIIWGIC